MTLEEVRRQIDAIDSQLVPLFCRRMDCSREVAKIKERENLPMFNAQREEEIPVSYTHLGYHPGRCPEHAEF